MSFSFDATAGASQSTSKPQFEGNNIYEVEFDGCEVQDIQGVKDPSMVYKVLKFKYSNEEGAYEHTIFEPRSSDFERTATEFTNKNGNIEKIAQPSNVEGMMLFFKHNIDAFVPSIAKEIDDGTKSLGASDWDKLRLLVSKIMEKGKGNKSKIKLIKDKNGAAKFPGFFTGLTKPDSNGKSKAYIRNNFIGSKLAFTPYEMTKITNSSVAKVTPIDSFTETSTSLSNDTDLDLDFEL